jgi:hypothetical protein
LLHLACRIPCAVLGVSLLPWLGVFSLNPIGL